MNTIVITPPLVQLNTPYPSGAYLKSYFTSQDQNSTWLELNIHFFYSIFSRSGLTKLFELSQRKALELAAQAEKKGDSQTAFNIRRYLSTKSLWIEWIDFITATLRGEQNREKQHQFIFSPFVPRGNRMENYLGNLQTEPGADDVRFLCSLALADLADYINVCFDSSFSLISYAESVCPENPKLSDLEKLLDTPVLEHFYKPVLDRIFKTLGTVLNSDFGDGPEFRLWGRSLTQTLGTVLNSDFGDTPSFQQRGRTLGSQSEKNSVAPVQSLTRFCISVPFEGTLIPALYTARYLKNLLGNKAYICLGGGYVNTCLRNFKDPGFFKYADALSFDRGYGSYWELDKMMAREPGVALSPSVSNSPAAGDAPPEDTFSAVESGSESGAGVAPSEDTFSAVTSCSDMANPPASGNGPSQVTFPPLYKLRQFSAGKVIEPLWTKQDAQAFEEEITAQIVPDYSDIDFSLYPRLCDDKNPMHRLWTDGAWIKAYLAHGCYWHKCTFCDTKLDYVCGFKTVDVEKLYEGLNKTSREKKVYGIHFVDEAIPPAAIKKFALLNAQNGNALYYWGNVRFEKPYTKDFAALLSYCGLGAVSAGIEVATGKGLKNINKGTDLQSIVSACAAFKEAGILVHAYMIYGFWYDTPQTIIDSMETLRQFFAAGLLDSAFWHKFELTPNSEAYDNLKDTWKGGKEYKKFGKGLENALGAWMQGQGLDEKVQSWFDFSVPQPGVSKRLVENAIEEYERENEKRVQTCKDLKNVYWLGGDIICSQGRAVWNYLMEENILTAGGAGVREGEFEEICGLLEKLKPETSVEDRTQAVATLEKKINISALIKALSNKGLCVL